MCSLGRRATMAFTSFWDKLPWRKIFYWSLPLWLLFYITQALLIIFPLEWIYTTIAFDTKHFAIMESAVDNKVPL